MSTFLEPLIKLFKCVNLVFDNVASFLVSYITKKNLICISNSQENEELLIKVTTFIFHVIKGATFGIGTEFQICQSE